jgi:polyisoprenoid-binding protein YceI
MALNNLFLIDNVVYGTPSGNYDGSSADFDTDGVKAVGYYQGQGGIQTMGIRTTDMLGVITLQATIDNEWQTADWFDVYEYGDASSEITDHRVVTLTGNFTWVRARITFFEAGTINFVNITY